MYQFFPYQNPKYALMVMLENQIAKDLIYNYRGAKLEELEMRQAGTQFMWLAK